MRFFKADWLGEWYLKDIFQFSFWDSDVAYVHQLLYLLIRFQFSFWDSPLAPASPSPPIISLSILFLRFWPSPGAATTATRKPSWKIFQFSFWDSDCYWKVLQKTGWRILSILFLRFECYRQVCGGTKSSNLSILFLRFKFGHHSEYLQQMVAFQFSFWDSWI